MRPKPFSRQRRSLPLADSLPQAVSSRFIQLVCIFAFFSILLWIAIPGFSEEETDTYSPRLIQGWNVYINDQLLSVDHELGERALELLRTQLYAINRAIPPKALEKLHTVKIWIDRENPLFPGCVYHPSADWLRDHGIDPQKAQSVHIANATHFLDWSLDQPAMVLHEMAHAYHHQVLGYDYPEIQNAFHHAVESQSYESVLYCRGDKQRAYAMNNDQEYFAELSEAYFSVNDFYPFVRAEIQHHDPEMFEVLRKCWGE